MKLLSYIQAFHRGGAGFGHGRGGGWHHVPYHFHWGHHFGRHALLGIHELSDQVIPSFFAHGGGFGGHGGFGIGGGFLFLIVFILLIVFAVSLCSRGGGSSGDKK